MPQLISYISKTFIANPIYSITNFYKKGKKLMFKEFNKRIDKFKKFLKLRLDLEYQFYMG